MFRINPNLDPCEGILVIGLPVHRAEALKLSNNSEKKNRLRIVLTLLGRFQKTEIFGVTSQIFCSLAVSAKRKQVRQPLFQANATAGVQYYSASGVLYQPVLRLNLTY